MLPGAEYICQVEPLLQMHCMQSPFFFIRTQSHTQSHTLTHTLTHTAVLSESKLNFTDTSFLFSSCFRNVFVLICHRCRYCVASLCVSAPEWHHLTPTAASHVTAPTSALKLEYKQEVVLKAAKKLQMRQQQQAGCSQRDPGVEDGSQHIFIHIYI